MNATPVLERTSRASDIGARFDAIGCELEQVRRADRTMASDEQRLAWIEQARGLQRQVDALAVILVGEADEANSAMRARHSHLQDWLARSGQETTRQAMATVWAARELERRPQVRDAAATGQISLGQARAINTALDGLPAGLDRAERVEAESLMLAAADHAAPDVLRGMSEKVLARVAPQQAETPEARAERLTQRDLRAASRRCLRFGAECDGSLDFSGNLPIVDARRLQHLVQTVADRSYRAAKEAHNRQGLLLTPQQRLADALVVVVTAAERREDRRHQAGAVEASARPGSVRAGGSAGRGDAAIDQGAGGGEAAIDRGAGRGEAAIDQGVGRGEAAIDRGAGRGDAAIDPGAGCGDWAIDGGAGRSGDAAGRSAGHAAARSANPGGGVAAPGGSIPDGATRISVVMSVDDLMDRAIGRGLLADGTELSPGELRRLACGAELIPVVLGTGSTVVDVGYGHRLAPWPLRHAVGLRDGGCAFPGCTAPLEHCDIHHIVPWQDGGPTSLANLVALCRSHHGLIEPLPPARGADGRLERADQWQVRIDDRGLPEFLPPAALDPHRRPIRRVVGHVQELLDTG